MAWDTTISKYRDSVESKINPFNSQTRVFEKEGIIKPTRNPLGTLNNAGSNINNTGKIAGRDITDTFKKAAGDTSQSLKDAGGQYGDLYKGLLKDWGLDKVTAPYKVNESAYLGGAGGSGPGGSGSSYGTLGASAAARPSVITDINFRSSNPYLIDQTNSNQFRNQQNTLASQLTDQANGIGPSLAQSQLQQGRDANIASAMALGASQRGLTAGQGLRQIADQTTNANQLAAQDAARLRLQEQLAAREQLGSVLSGARSQDIGIAAQDANTQTSVGQNNANLYLAAQTQQQNAALKQQAQNDEMVKAYLNAGLSMDQARMKAAQDLEKLKSDNYNAEQTRGGNILGGFGQMIGTLGSAYMKSGG